MEPTINKLLKELSLIKNSFDSSTNKRKEIIITRLSKTKEFTARQLMDIHEVLLFLSAHAHSANFLKQVRKVAAMNEAEIKKRLKKGDKASGRIFHGTGVTGSHVQAAVSFELVNWLVKTYPEQVTLDSIGAGAEEACGIVSTLLPWQQREDFNEGAYASLEDWLDKAVSRNRYQQLNFLLQLLGESSLNNSLRDFLFDQLEIYIDADLSRIPSRTNLHLDLVSYYYHHEPLIRSIDARTTIQQPLRALPESSAAEKEKIITAFRLQLFSLFRETDPGTYADPNDLKVYDAGRGLSIVLAGMDKHHRQPIDAYIGYMAFKNGQPYSYGGAWMLGPMAKIGINIFPSYRGGESAWFFAQLMRVYYHEFKPAYFIAEPYQVGRHNPEGIETGAFWFYYRLGFRPVQKKIQQLATIEFEKLKSGKIKKTPHKILETLVEDELVFVPGEQHDAIKFKYDTHQLSRGIMKYIASRYGGHSHTASKKATEEICKSLHIAEEEFPKYDAGLSKLSLYLAAGGGVDGFDKNEKAALKDIILEKSQGTDSAFAKKAAAHIALQKLLLKLALGR